MDFIAIGIAHEDIHIREQVSFTISQKLDFLNQLKTDQIHQVVILSTCNRSEVYAYVHKEDVSILLCRYRSFFHLSQEQKVALYEGKSALQHLIEVSCGWDSQIVGEDQILKQVKEAYSFSIHAGCAQKEIHMVFQEAFRVTKIMKHTYQGSEHPRSTSYVAMKRLKKTLCLKDKKILFCGGGLMIQSCLPYLQGEALRCIYVAMRHPHKEQVFAKHLDNLTIVPFSDVRKLWYECDIIISATASPHLMFSYHEMKSDGRKRWILDLALPRDIDPAFRNDEDYTLWDIDEIQRVVMNHNHMREEARSQGVEAIREEVDDIYHKLQHIKAEIIIEDMHKRMMSLADHTYELLNQKLDLSQHERRTMKKIVEYSNLRFIQEWRGLIEQADKEQQALLLHLFQQEEVNV